MSEEAEDPRERPWYGRPLFIRKINGFFTLFWAAWFVPAVAVKGFRNSVFLVGVYSVWANLVSHYTAWITARVEVRQEKVEIDIVDSGT